MNTVVLPLDHICNHRSICMLSYFIAEKGNVFEEHHHTFGTQKKFRRQYEFVPKNK